MPTVQGTWKLFSHRFKGVPCLDPSADLVVTRDDDLWTFRFAAGGSPRIATTSSRNPITEFDLLDETNAVKIQGKRLLGPALETIIGLVYAAAGNPTEPSDADVFLAVRVNPTDEP